MHALKDDIPIVIYCVNNWVKYTSHVESIFSVKPTRSNILIIIGLNDRVILNMVIP